jgi:hypothetical protein
MALLWLLCGSGQGTVVQQNLVQLSPAAAAVNNQ